MARPKYVTITQAAVETGASRRTIQRWLKAGRLHKRTGGLIAIADVRRCAALRTTGRRCGVTRVYAECSCDEGAINQLGSVAAICDAYPFLKTEGLRRLRRVLRVVVLNCHRTGKAATLTEILTDALVKSANQELAEREHWHRFRKHSQNSKARGDAASWRRTRLANAAIARGEKPPRLYWQDKPFVVRRGAPKPEQVERPSEITDRLRRQRAAEIAAEAEAKRNYRPSF